VEKTMASNVGMTSNAGNLQKVLDSASARIVSEKTRQTLQAAKAGVNSQTAATLRSSVTGASHQDIEGRVGSNDPAVLFEEEGTRPHIIRPRNGRVLKFPGTGSFSGKTIFTAIVHHPGTRGKHALRNALRSVIR
jgi:hypothetical protein